MDSVGVVLVLGLKELRIEGALDNAKEAIGEAGKALAAAMQARLRSGTDGAGQPLPPPEDGGSPFNRTGKFIGSIKFRRMRGSELGGGLVGPTGSRTRRGRKSIKAAAAKGGTGSTSIGGSRRGEKRGRLANTNADLARLYLARTYWSRGRHANLQLIGALPEDRDAMSRIIAEKVRVSIRATKEK